MRLAFVIPGQPVAKGRPRFARRGAFVHTYTPDTTTAYQGVVRWHAKQAWQEKALDGMPLKLVVRCFLAIPKSWSKKKRAGALDGSVRPLGKPDWDNLGKIVSDALNGVIYRDDSTIWDARVTKQYSDVARTEISLMWVNGADSL